MKAVTFIHVLYLVLIKTFVVKGVSKCESKVELRAVLLSCPTKDTGCDDDDLLSQVIKSEEAQIFQAESKNFDPFEEEKENDFSNAVKDCKRKLVITLKIRNSGRIPCDDEYIVVDHVFDPLTGGRARLLSPVVLKLRQEQMAHLYGLEFQRVVNGDPFEQQITSDQTCSVSPENPTCGIAMYDGKPIPFSEGFCCSSDSRVNAKRSLTPANQGDALLSRDYKMIYQGNPHFVRNKKVPIVDPKLVKLRRRSSKETVEDKKSIDCGGLNDPLSYDKVPNYLLEHDRKVVCDRGDFMSELCKLQEDKYSAAEPSSSEHFQNKVDEKGREKESGEIRTGVGAEEVDLRKGHLATVASDRNTRKDSFLKDDKGLNVILTKNYIKTLNDESTETGTLSNNYGSVKGSRGKRENRNENKKLTLEEKLERFVNSKSHLTGPRKRLLELSHKRRRKVSELSRCVRRQEQTATPLEYLTRNYEKPSASKYFFSHDKIIINPLESPDSIVNASVKDSYKLHSDKNFKLYEKKNRLQPEKLFYDNHLKNDKDLKIKDNTFQVKAGNKNKERGKFKSNARKMEMKAEDFQESLKTPHFATENERYNLFKGIQENKVKKEEAEIQKEKKPVAEERHREQKLSRLNRISLKNLFDKNDSSEKLTKSNRIRNFFMAKSRDKQKLKSESVKANKGLEEGLKKTEAFKLENEKNNEVNSAENEEKTEKNAEQSEKLTEEKLTKTSGETQYNIAEKESIKNIDEVKEKEEEKTSEEKNFAKQSASANEALDSNRNSPSKEFMGDTDFSFEIIHQNPDDISPKLHQNFGKLVSNDHKSPSLDTKSHDPINKYNMKDLPLRFKHPQKYYVLENEVTPNDMYLLQSNKNPFREVINRQHYLKEPEKESGMHDSVRRSRRLQPEIKSFLQRRPILHHRFPELEYAKYDDDLTRYPKSSYPSYNIKLKDARLRGKRYSDLLRRFENDFGKIGYRPQVLRGGMQLRPEKIRNKRTASCSFPPAGGLFSSKFDSQTPEDGIVNYLPKTKGRKNEKVNNWTNSRSANAISNSKRLPNEFKCALSALREKTVNLAFDKQRLIQSYMNAPNYVLEEVEASLKEKRQVTYPGKYNFSQEGEDLSPESEPDSQDTAHCMRFGDMWYNLYSIKRPMVSQTVGIQLFDKRSYWDGTSQWRDLTKGKMIRVGTYMTKAEDELPSISINFIGGNSEESETAFDPDNYFLLIPSHVSNPSKINFYPQFEGGPREYMLVQSKDVSSGGECNMVGTSFEAFARQPDRCNQRKGSCLKRQPIDMWREDMEARIRGNKGKYFVENFGVVSKPFGTVSDPSLKTYTNLTGEYLALDYYGDYTSLIEIELKADSNAVVRKGSSAQIPLVYVDSTYPKKTRIILSVLNVGLTSSFFRPRLADCPPNLDPAWCPLVGPLWLIPPQQRHDFKLDLSGVLPKGKIIVSVQVLNQFNKKVASRSVTIRKGDRCVCAFHCKCNCFGSSNDRTCRRLSLRDYRRAGYWGPFPYRSSCSSASESIFKNIHIVLITASYFLLFLGVVKGILGIFNRRIGIAGVRVITGPRELSRYYECELHGCSVLFDECGFPVHPTSCHPVQIVPLWIEVIINIFFFFLYPLKGLWFLILSLPCCKRICSDCDGGSRHDQGDSRPLLSKGFSPSCVHYNVTTINSKKSKQDEFLPYPIYKGDDDPLEEDDTEFVLQEMKRYRKE